MDAASPSACPHCFGDLTSTPCPHCGWQPNIDNPPPALALGTLLDGRYRIGRVLGHGGFGITYLARDENLHLRLAIKEYLPRDCAARAPDGVSLAIYSGQAGEQFAYGLDRFLDEARALARFDQHPGIVTVKSFFRAHGTGYCVMDYVEGLTLRQYLERQPDGRIPVEQALRLLGPVMDALRAVHKEGLLHRDLSPDNIYLSRSGRVKLLDFGAARFAVGEYSRSLSIILKPGYAPEEQYRTHGNQGPWTDIYGLAATFYRAITGRTPPDALDRLEHDDLILPSKLDVAMTPDQEQTLLHALAVKASERFQSIKAWQSAWRDCKTKALGAKPGAPASSHQGASTGSVDDKRVERKPVSAKKKRPRIGSGVNVLLVILLIGPVFALIGFNLFVGVFDSIRSSATPQSENVSDGRSLSQTADTASQTVSHPVSAPTLPGSLEEGLSAHGAGDYDRALSIWRLLAMQDDADAQFFIGAAYQRGLGVPKQGFQAVRWYSKAAAQGHAAAQANLGAMYLEGQGIAKDETQALSLFRESAEQQDPLGQYFMGLLYANGRGVSRDDSQAAYWFRSSAEQGYADAQAYLGVMYMNGRGVAQDDAQAVKWFRQASEQSNAEAEYFLGSMLAQGRGTAQDDTQAVQWLRKSAEQGVAAAEFALSLMYAAGRGVAQDDNEAMTWLKRAAEQGETDAQAELGERYLNGRGVARDDIQAEQWLRRAAVKSHADSQFALGAMFLDGRGAKQDDEQAVKWIRQAAEQGHVDAQYLLGLMYAYGRGIDPSEDQALEWLVKAAKQGHSAANAILDARLRR